MSPARTGDVDFPPDLLARLRTADTVVVLTGAGVSAESGVPTFRDASTGLWARYDPEDLATHQSFSKDPALVWGWYEWRRMNVARAQPNPAHLAIAAMAARFARFTLVTQNVDDLHERTGSQAPLHLHGSLFQPRCAVCDQPHALRTGLPDEPEGGRRLDPPRCTHCGGWVRPGVVWFGEALPVDTWRAALTAVQECDVLFSVGTSALVHPAASLAGEAARRGATVIQVNPRRTDIEGQATHNLRGPAGVILPALFRAVWPNHAAISPEQIAGAPPRI